MPANYFVRNGAPIELTALLKLALDFLVHLHENKFSPYEGVETSKN